MWVEIDGIRKNYKSINFTHLKGKLLDGTKSQTCRTTFIPKYRIGEIIAISFLEEFLFLVPIENRYPAEIKDFTLDEAVRDGFGTIKEFQEKIMEINNIKYKDHWTFLTSWDPKKRIFIKPITTLEAFA